MSELRQEETQKTALKPDETTYGILKDFVKLCFPTMVTTISQQILFIVLLISREFDSTDKMAAVGLAITIISFYVTWILGVTVPNASLTA